MFVSIIHAHKNIDFKVVKQSSYKTISKKLKKNFKKVNFDNALIQLKNITQLNVACQKKV